MREDVRSDIIAVLSGTVSALEKNDVSSISELSDHVIHNASIFQDEDSILVAVLVYSIGKVVSRSVDYGAKVPSFISLLNSAVESLRVSDFHHYNLAIKKAMSLIRSSDEKIGVYVQEVLDQAKIKKGFKMHEHGLSMGRVSYLLGISKWALMSYFGNVIPQREEGVSVKTRLAWAREFFS